MTVAETQNVVGWFDEILGRLTDAQTQVLKSEGWIDKVTGFWVSTRFIALFERILLFREHYIGLENKRSDMMLETVLGLVD